jgi:hypothetical protein
VVILQYVPDFGACSAMAAILRHRYPDTKTKQCSVPRYFFLNPELVFKVLLKQAYNDEYDHHDDDNHDQ